jgi:hypothetical protein
VREFRDTRDQAGSDEALSQSASCLLACLVAVGIEDQKYLAVPPVAQLGKLRRR